MQAHSEALSYSRRTDAAIWTWCSSKGQKGQHQTCRRFWCGEYLCKIMKRYWQFLQSYHFHKAAWPWASFKVQKGHTKINIELIRDFDVENSTIKLQLDTWNLWRVIAFTRSSQMLHARMFKKRSYKGQDQTWLKFWWVEHHSLYRYNMKQANSDAKWRFRGGWPYMTQYVQMKLKQKNMSLPDVHLTVLSEIFYIMHVLNYVMILVVLQTLKSFVLY